LQIGLKVSITGHHYRLQQNTLTTKRERVCVCVCVCVCVKGGDSVCVSVREREGESRVRPSVKGGEKNCRRKEENDLFGQIVGDKFREEGRKKILYG